jgi:hypothetical protein
MKYDSSSTRLAYTGLADPAGGVTGFLIEARRVPEVKALQTSNVCSFVFAKHTNALGDSYKGSKYTTQYGSGKERRRKKSRRIRTSAEVGREGWP